MRTNVLTLVITLTLGIILAGSLLMPVISDAQRTAGEEVHYDNIQSGYNYRLTEKNEAVTVAITGSGGDIYYNGEIITDSGFCVYSDSVSIRADSINRFLYVSTPTQALEFRVSWASNYTFIYSNGICTITNVGTSTVLETAPYTWLYVPDDSGEWVTVTGSSTHYVNSINDIICNGYYSTGENDTGYTVRNGVATVSDSTYTAGLEYTLTPVAGTTDVYTVATFKVLVDDESFTPWFMLIQRDIVGHEASGAAYALYGAIPVLVIIGLVLAATAAIVVKRND